VSISVKIDDPALPKGYEISIDGLGTFENGKAKTIDAEVEQAFSDSRGISVKEALKSNPNVTVEGTTEAKKGGES
jgi:hypothetical protein